MSHGFARRCAHEAIEASSCVDSLMSSAWPLPVHTARVGQCALRLLGGRATQ